jgi:hypothetical protein
MPAPRPPPFVAVTGCLTFALAVRRLVVPVTPAVSWYPLAVAAASVPVYAVRSACERSSGLRGGNMSLVSESVDSRNHAMLEPAIDELIQHGLLLSTEPLAISAAGRRQLQRAFRRL